MTSAAWEANITRVSSSSFVNSSPVIRVAHEDVAHQDAPVEHGRRHEAVDRPHRRGSGEAQAPQVLHQVGQAQGLGDAGQGLEDAQAVRHEPELLRLIAAQPGGEEVLQRAVVAEEGHHAVACAGQGAGRVQRPLEHLVEVQALVYAQAGRTEARQALPQRLDLPVPNCSELAPDLFPPGLWRGQPCLSHGPGNFTNQNGS